MSLFGTNAGFGTGGTGVFGNATTDSHNPMKVNQRSIWALYVVMIHLKHLSASGPCSSNVA